MPYSWGFRGEDWDYIVMVPRNTQIPCEGVHQHCLLVWDVGGVW